MDKLKIVFLETGTLGDDVNITQFSELGDVVTYHRTVKDEIPERIKDADVVIINKLPMCEETLKDALNVKLICLTATGTNNIDFPYTNSRGIVVKNVASYSTESVVQHTFALLFYIYEKMAYFDGYVKCGDYAEAPFFTHIEEKFHELYGKTWGIIGLGEIGRRVAQVAECFGCNVIYYSTSGSHDDDHFKRVSLDELLKQSDIVSIHAPLNENTKDLINADALSKMKKTAYLINVGRGPIVNEEDLIKALKNEEIAGAGLDVLAIEPMDKNCALRYYQDSTRLVITPHIAWATAEARCRCVDRVFDNVCTFVKTGK